MRLYVMFYLHSVERNYFLTLSQLLVRVTPQDDADSPQEDQRWAVKSHCLLKVIGLLCILFEFNVTPSIQHAANVYFNTAPI